MADGESEPDLADEVKNELTLEESTAAHCARPSVPPSDLNCIRRCQDKIICLSSKTEENRRDAYEEC